MAARNDRTALKWLFRRPLARRGRLAALFAASLFGALLGGASLTSAYPLLVILFDREWATRLAERSEHAPSWLRPLFEGLVSFAREREP